MTEAMANRPGAWRELVGTSLLSRILRANLLVGLIGLAGMAVLLSLNWHQGRTTLRMAKELTPTALAASNLMLGLSASQANLNAWVTLGEQRFREAWQTSWHEEILPTFDELRASDDSGTFQAQIDPLLDQLMTLEEAQWWVQEFAGSAGNDRAAALLQRDLLPLLDSLYRHVDALSTLAGRGLTTDRTQQLVRISALQSDLRLFESWAHELAASREQHLLQRISQVSARISSAFERMNEPEAGSLESDLRAAAHRDWRAVAELTSRFAQLVQSGDSKAAEFVMRTRAVPLADQVSAQASALVGLVRQRLASDTEGLIRDARSTLLGALFILALIAASCGLISWWLSQRLARPVAALSRAVSKFSRGQMDQDLPLPKTRELAELTQAFNEMRRHIDELLTDLGNTNKELEQFAYTVSHDLRAPLRAINGFSQALVEDYGDRLDGEAKEYLDLLSQGAVDMGQLIDDILWLSRSTRGEMQLTTVDVSQLTEEIVSDLRRAEPQRPVEASIEPGIRVRGDQRLLKNMLTNLVDNAWKFTAHSAPARINMTSRTDGDRIKIVLEDNGVGFDMTYADKLFKPFHRLHSEADYPGTGIGLSSVLRIVNRHRGQIEAWGEPGKGARMTIEFEKGKGEWEN